MAGTNWITAGDGSRPEADRSRRWIMTGGGSRPGIDHNWIWMHDWRWLTGDVSQEMNHGRWMTINLLSYTMILRLCDFIPFSKSWTLISNHEGLMECSYACIQCTAGVAPPSTIPSTIQSTAQSTTQSTCQSSIQRYRIMQLHARVPMLNMIPNQIPRLTVTLLTPHISTVYEVSRQQSNDL